MSHCSYKNRILVPTGILSLLLLAEFCGIQLFVCIPMQLGFCLSLTFRVFFSLMASIQVAEQYAVVKSEAEATSAILEGCKVQILPRSTTDRKEKQALADLVTSMGGTISATVPKTARRIEQNLAATAGPQTTDFVIVGSAEPKGYVRDLATHVRERGTEYDVLSAKWLEVCRERGRTVEPLPRHYKHVCDVSLERLAELDGYDMCAFPRLWCAETETSFRYRVVTNSVFLITYHASIYKYLVQPYPVFHSTPVLDFHCT